jgi:hypothetical protein
MNIGFTGFHRAHIGCGKIAGQTREDIQPSYWDFEKPIRKVAPEGRISQSPSDESACPRECQADRPRTLRMMESS